MPRQASELIEWAAAWVADPKIGLAYVGAQGDVWDGQKDMALAMTGAAAASRRRCRGRAADVSQTSARA